MFLPKETIYLGTPETLFRCQSTRSSVPGLYRLWLNIQPLSSFLWLRPARLISPWLKPGVLRRGLIKHLAGNRDYALYLAIKARFEEIDEPKLLVNTEDEPQHCLEQCLSYILETRPQ